MTPPAGLAATTHTPAAWPHSFEVGSKTHHGPGRAELSSTTSRVTEVPSADLGQSRNAGAGNDVALADCVGPSTRIDSRS